jgi:putative endonuclease
MPSFVYVLGCKTPDRCLTYVGWTTDVERRLAQHNGGTGARSTRGRVWVLLHTEKLRTRRQAMSREWHLKRDRKFRKALAFGIAAQFMNRKVSRAKIGSRTAPDHSM